MVASTTVGGGPSRRPPSTTTATSSARKACATSAASVKRRGTVRHGPCSRQSRRSALPSGMPTTTAQEASASPPAASTPSTDPDHGRNTSTGPGQQRRNSVLSSSVQAEVNARRVVDLTDRIVGPVRVGRQLDQACLGLGRTGPHGQAVAADVGDGHDRTGHQRLPHRGRTRRDHRRARVVRDAARSIAPLSPASGAETCHQRPRAARQIGLDAPLVVPQLLRQRPRRRRPEPGPVPPPPRPDGPASPGRHPGPPPRRPGPPCPPGPVRRPARRRARP